MMSTTAPQPATTPIPVQLSEPEFEAFLLPHLSMPKRGPKCPKGEQVIAIIGHHGSVLTPVPVAPVNATDMVLLPEGLRALKKVATEVGLGIRGAYCNLHCGWDSTPPR